MSELNDLERSHFRMVAKLLAGAVVMFVFAVAVLPPLYEVLCEITGLNGKTASVAASEAVEMDEDRVVTVQFVTRAAQGMPWEFSPEVRSVRVHPGEITKVVFNVRNPTDSKIVGQAIPSVSPGQAAPHLLKTECFCFENQSLEAGGEAGMPMIFYLDPALPKHMTTITLSYTLFDVTERVTVNDNTLAVR